MPDPAIDLIRERMARIRARAQGKAGRLGEETRQFLDWKHYVRIFPWGSIAAAAAFGYMMVPRSAPLTRSDTGALAAQFAREQQAMLEAQKKVEAAVPAPGLLGGVVNLATSTLWRLGMAYAGRELSNILIAALSPPEAKPQAAETPEPPRQPRREQTYDDFVRRPA